VTLGCVGERRTRFKILPTSCDGGIPISVDGGVFVDGHEERWEEYDVDGLGRLRSSLYELADIAQKSGIWTRR